MKVIKGDQSCIKWNNHDPCIMSSLSQLMETESMGDATINYSKGKSISVHKMILAANSNYFYYLLKELQGVYPVIFIRHAREEILNYLVEFMYSGETCIKQSDLCDFFELAELLQIKGLSKVENKPQTIENTNYDKKDKKQLEGKGSRIKKMIESEVSILWRCAENYEESINILSKLPTFTNDLMKSRRACSLGLAISEVLTKTCNIKSAALKYKLPKETLRKHYKKYLKSLEIKKEDEKRF